MECPRCRANGIRTVMMYKDSHWYCGRCGHVVWKRLNPDRQERWEKIFTGALQKRFPRKPLISKEEGAGYVWTQKGREVPIPKQEGRIKCPHCGQAWLQQHRRKPELLVCPLCWWKYDKEAAQRGEFIRVKKKVKHPGWAHPRGY